MRYARMSCGFTVAAIIAAWAGSAGASPAQSPTPVAGTPSCDGLIVADFNHDTVNRFGNPNSSQGPGSFFGPFTHDAIEGLARGPNC